MHVYISCPLTEDVGKLSQVSRKLTELGYGSWWYERGTTYDDTKLRISDIFVLIAKANSFEMSLDHMSAGCRKELALAKSLGKPLYLAYWKGGKNLQIYSINLNKLETGSVQGISKVYLRLKAQIINNYEIF